MAFVRDSAWRAWALKCFITRLSSTLRWSPTNLYFFCSNLFEKIIQIWNKFNYLFCSSASLPFGSWLIRVVRWHTSSWFSVQAAYTLGLLDIFYKKHIIFDWPESKPSCPPWEHPCQWRRLAPEPFSGSLPSPVPSKPKIFILLSSIQTFKFYLNSYCHGALMYNWIRTFVSILCVTLVWPPVWSDATQNRYPVWTDYSKILLWLTLSQTLKTSSYWSGDDGQCMKCLAQSQPQ